MMDGSRKRALKIAGIYLLFGLAWITVSDRLLATLVPDASTISQVSMYKGWVFIFVTATLVYFMTKRALALQERLTLQARLNENQFRAVIDTTDTGFVVLDEQGKVLQANTIYAHMTGHVTPDEMVGHSVVEWTAPHDRERNAGEVLKCSREGKVRNLTIDYCRPDGTIIPVEINATTVPTRAGTVIVTLCRDLTQQKNAEARRLELEAQLLQSQKMEAVGQLAGGLAHDMNNILSVIMGNAFLLSATSSGEQKKTTEQIIEAVKRASELTKGLLAFSRKQVLQKKSVDLNELIAKMSGFLQRLLPENITLIVDTTDFPIYALVDRVQIEQVLMNLTTNARDSMEQGGKIRITLEQTPANDTDSTEAAMKTPCACITVQDTGRGMDETTKARIFEPFFTTKEEGKGTGLGLAMVFGIIKQHGGEIRVESELGRGTSFTIFLPLLAENERKNISQNDNSQKSAIPSSRHDIKA